MVRDEIETCVFNISSFETRSRICSIKSRISRRGQDFEKKYLVVERDISLLNLTRFFEIEISRHALVWGASYLNVGRGTIEMTVNCAPLSLHVVPSMPSPTPHPSSTPLYEHTAPAAEYCQQALFTRCSKPRNSAASGCCATEVGLTGGKDGGWAWRWCKYSLEGA